MTDRRPHLVAAEFGDAHEEWCDTCRAYTLICAPLYFLTPAGVTLSQHIAMCTVHESPEYDEERPRIPPR